MDFRSVRLQFRLPCLQVNFPQSRCWRSYSGSCSDSAGCGPEEEIPPTLTPSPPATGVPAAPTATPRPSPTPSPTPTPLPPALEAEYQLIDEDGLLQVAAVTIPEDGWLVAYPDDQLELDAERALGWLPVPAGQSAELSLEIDPDWPERTVQLALHGGRTGEAFAPTADNLLLLETLEIDTRATVPALEVADQPVMADGVVTIGRVFMPRPGWLAIFPAGVGEDLTAADLLGYAPLQAGETTSITVAIRWREAPTTLSAVLLSDASRNRCLTWRPTGRSPLTATSWRLISRRCTPPISSCSISRSSITALRHPFLNCTYSCKHYGPYIHCFTCEHHNDFGLLIVNIGHIHLVKETSAKYIIVLLASITSFGVLAMFIYHIFSTSLATGLVLLVFIAGAFIMEFILAKVNKRKIKKQIN